MKERQNNVIQWSWVAFGLFEQIVRGADAVNQSGKFQWCEGLWWPSDDWHWCVLCAGFGTGLESIAVGGD
jgi:hypothetical protein